MDDGDINEMCSVPYCGRMFMLLALKKDFVETNLKVLGCWTKEKSLLSINKLLRKI